MKHTRMLTTAAATAALVTGSATAAQAAAPDRTSAAATCPPVAWGSQPQHHLQSYSTGAVGAVRAGRHTCFDRVVVDVSGSSAMGYDVRYVDQVLHDPMGTVVPLRGGARLQVSAQSPYWGKARSEMADVTGFTTLRQVAAAGSFEGQSTWGVGVRARLPFRTFVLHDTRGTHLVIDIAHSWN